MREVVDGMGFVDYGMLGERFRIVGCILSLKILFQKLWSLASKFASWPRMPGLARNDESSALGGLLFSWEPLRRWILGKFSAAARHPQPSGAHVVQFQHVWKGCSNVLQVVLLLCLNEVAQIQ